MFISKKILTSILENILIILFFIISLTNLVGLITFIIFSFFLLIQKEKGIIKLILLLSLRFIISEGIDNNHGYLHLISIYKYSVLFVLIPIIIIFKSKVIKNSLLMKKFLIVTLLCFLVFLITSLIVSNYPLVSIAKLLNYFVPLTEIVLLTWLSKGYFNLLRWLSNYFVIIFLASTFLMLDYRGYLLNGFSFQGILNHPNIYGVLSVVGIVVIITKLITSKINLVGKIFMYFVLVIAILELVLTNSRSSILALIISIILFIIFSKLSILSKLFILALISFIFFISLTLPTVSEFIIKFVRKGQSSEHILLSRYGQISNLDFVLKDSPLLGIGFGVPVNKSSLELDDFVFEAGNIFFGLIIFTGIFGLIIYIIYLFSIIFINGRIKRNFIVLFISTILVNTGEMIMFSSNNAGIFCFILWSIYISSDLKDESLRDDQKEILNEKVTYYF